MFTIVDFITCRFFNVLPIDQQLANLKQCAKRYAWAAGCFFGGAFSASSSPCIMFIRLHLYAAMIHWYLKMKAKGRRKAKKINQWTRYLTVIVTAFQAAAYIAYLKILQCRSADLIQQHLGFTVVISLLELCL